MYLNHTEIEMILITIFLNSYIFYVIQRPDTDLIKTAKKKNQI